MTNSEAIEQLKFLKKVDFYIDTKEACDIAIDLFQEKDKFKAEVEQLKEENEQLKISDASKEQSSIDYYNLYRQTLNEVKQLKSELEQSVKLPLTNADKIHSMSDEELADFITSQRKSKCNDGICVGSEYCYYNNDNECSCNSSIFEWLKSEVSE